MKLHPNARTTPHSRALLVERVRSGWTRAEAAEAADISVRTVDKWLRRFQQHGHAGLLDRSSRPHNSPTGTHQRIVRRIRQLRLKRWTGERIANQLGMAISTVHAVLRRLAMNRLRDLEPKPAPVRYERSVPGELIHIDTKKLGKIGRIGHRIHGDRTRATRGIGWEFVHVCVDDATRLAYVEVLPDERAESAVAFLKRAVRWLAKKKIVVQQIMTDNGPAYLSRHHADACQQLGIRHLRTRPYTPRTNGKAERFIGTMLREAIYAKAYANSNRRATALRSWLHEYNYSRPHRGLARQTPVQRLRQLR